MSIELLSIIISTIFGSTGLITLFMTRAEKKALLKVTEGNALETMQKVYDHFVMDTEKQIGIMREEIKMMHTIIKAYKDKCDNCKKA